MARYRKSGVKFSPFTYEQMLAPIIEIQKVHDELEKNYGALKIQAAQWQNKADREKDPVAHAQYSRFAADLNNQAQLLASSGVTPLLKRGIYDMAGRYAAEVHPIEEAYKRRVLLADEQRKLEQQDPTRLFERQANQMSLDEFLKNPQADYGNSVSGALLTAQVAQAAESLSKEARDSEEGRGKLKKLVLPYQYEYIKQQGFKREDILQAIARNPNASKILTGLVDQVIGASGVLDWGDPSTIQKAYWYAGQGLYKAIGQTTSQIVTDSYSMQDALARKAAARAAKQAKIPPTDVVPTNIKGGRLNPRALRSRVELDKNNQQIRRYIDKGYIVMDKSKGHYILTSKGANALNVTKIARIRGVTPSQTGFTKKIGNDYYNVEDPNFFDFFKQINGGQSVYTEYDRKKGTTTYYGTTGPGNAGLLFQKYVNDNKEGAYDTYHSTEYIHQLSNEDGNEVMRQIQGHANGKYTEVDFNGKNGWNHTNTYDDSDLNGYSVQSLNYSKYGTTATLVKDGKPPIRISLPKDYSSWYQENATNLVKQASVYDEHMNMSTPQIPIFNDAGQVIATKKLDNPQDRAKMEEIRDGILLDAMSFGINIPVTTTADEEKYSPF